MNWSPLNVLLQLAFALGLIAGVAAFAVALARKNQDRAAMWGLGLAGWIAAYLALVIGVSLTSHEQELARGQAKHFCGFYFDCHLNVSIENLARVPTSAPNDSAGLDVFVVVVKVGNDAKRETLTLHRPGIRIIDDQGKVFFPLKAAEDGQPLSHPIEAGKSYTARLYFELPSNLRNPRLLVTEMENTWPDNLFEMFLVGDEDSVLHQKVTLQL